MTRWEHTTRRAYDQNDERLILDSLEDDGWELTAVRNVREVRTPYDGYTGYRDYERDLYFKRAVPSPSIGDEK